MKPTDTLKALILLLLSTPLHSAGIKKWIDADGTLTYGDVPPPGATGTEIIRQPTLESGSETDSGSSLQNRLRRLQSDVRTRDELRRQQRDSARTHERAVQQATHRRHAALRAEKIRREKCHHYGARIGEYEHRTMQAYRNEGDRLRDESQLASLRKLEAEQCD